jgi:hypothetical protein
MQAKAGIEAGEAEFSRLTEPGSLRHSLSRVTDPASRWAKTSSPILMFTGAGRITCGGDSKAMAFRAASDVSLTLEQYVAETYGDRTEVDRAGKTGAGQSEGDSAIEITGRP